MRSNLFDLSLVFARRARVSAFGRLLIAEQLLDGHSKRLREFFSKFW